MIKNWQWISLTALILIGAFYYWNYHYDKIYLFGKSIPEHKIGDSLMLSIIENTKDIETIISSSRGIVSDKDSISFACFINDDNLFLFHYNNKRVKCILVSDKYYSFELPTKLSNDFYIMLKSKSVYINRDVDEIVDYVEEQVEKYERGKLSFKEMEKEPFNVFKKESSKKETFFI